LQLLLQSGHNNYFWERYFMAERRAGYRQIFDVRAALIASLVGVIAFWLTMMVLDSRTVGAPWFTVFSAASILGGGTELMGQSTTFNLGTVATGLLVYALVGLVFGVLISALIHEFGLIVGILGGALFGFCTYVLLYYVATRFGHLRDLAAVARWPLEVGHVMFGAVVGGVYESLERARYVRQ
jgi:hypothetical protein